jgi:hypothetical protein
METRTQPAPAAQDAGASPAEELPGLYRAILERVAELEGLGKRPEATRIRLDATQAYSRAWDEAGRRSLLGLIGRADRAIAGETQNRGGARTRTRTWVLRRRSAPAP